MHYITVSLLLEKPKQSKQSVSELKYALFFTNNFTKNSAEHIILLKLPQFHYKLDKLT